MGGGNLAIVERSLRATIERDWPRALEALDATVEVHGTRPTGVFRGPSGVQQARMRWDDAWAETRVEIEELIEAGDQVVVITHEYARSPRWGTRFDRRLVQVWTLRDGKVLEIRDYANRAEALAATRPNPATAGHSGEASG